MSDTRTLVQKLQAMAAQTVQSPREAAIARLKLLVLLDHERVFGDIEPRGGDDNRAYRASRAAPRAYPVRSKPSCRCPHTPCAICGHMGTTAEPLETPRPGVCFHCLDRGQEWVWWQLDANYGARRQEWEARMQEWSAA